MESVNKVFLVGHLGQDPELRHTNNGKAVTTLRLATSHRGTDGLDRTEWHRVVLWGKHAEHAVENLKKGDRVAAEGRLKTSTWTDNKGEKRSRTEIDGRVVFPRGNGNAGVTDSTDAVAVRSEYHHRDAPPCSSCGDTAAIRNGSCWVCMNCGSTTGCS